MYCTHCGNQIEDNARFCTQCGASQVDSEAPQQQAVQAPQQTTVPPPPAASWQQQAVQAPQGAANGWQQPVYGGNGYISPAQKSPKSLNKKHIIVIGCIVVLIAALAVGWYLYSREKEYQSNYERGLVYLNEGNYEEAVLAFNAAIEIKPKSAPAYTGRGDANTGLERYQDAVEDYQYALRYTDYAEAYMGLARVYLELGDLDSARQILNEGARATGDSRLAAWAAAMETSLGSGSLNGVVSEYLSNGGTALLPNAKVRLYLKLEDTLRLMRAAATDFDGSFSLAGLAAGEYILHVDAPDHIAIDTVETLSAEEARYTEIFLMIPETEATQSGELNTLYASVTNALNGNSVPLVDIRLRSGWNTQTGEYVAEATSDAWGEFSISGLAYGYYTVEASAQGYITAYQNVAVLPDEFQAQWDVPMSPLLNDGETRIVLTWGETPDDLDSHLEGDDFHVFYAERDYYDRRGVHRVNLDLDDTTSYGPETVTIYQGVDGVYTYSVYDYTNGGNASSRALSASGATVRVFQENGLVATYHVPTGFAGCTWIVFRINENGAIETVDTIR